MRTARALLLPALLAAALPLGACGEEPAPSRRAIARYGVPDEGTGESITVSVGTPVPSAPGPASTGPTTQPRPGGPGPGGPPPSGTAKYAVVEVKGGGKVVGTVKLSGAVDLGGHAIAVNKDVEKCGHGTSHPSERIVFDPATLGLKDSVVYLADIAQGKDWAGPMAEKKRVAYVDQKQCKYVPHVQVIRTETQLAILNSDAAEHNIHAYRNTLGTQQFNFGTAANTSNEKAADAFLKREAMYLLRCDIHPWMNATVFASKHPYYAVTDEQGRFALEQVPPGTYRVVCWHEGMKATPVLDPQGGIAGYTYSPDFNETRSVTVPADGEVTVDFVVPAP